MTRGMRGRADLLRALAQQNPALTAAMAALLDYHEMPLAAPAETQSSSTAARSSSVSSPTLPDAPYIPADVPFWRLETYEALIQDATPLAPPTTRSATDPVWRRRPQYTPAFTPLAPRRLIRTRLRQVAALRRATADLDLEAAIERLSRGELLREVPHRTRRAWGPALHIIEDRARRLVPYWRDQDDVTDMLQQMYPPDGVTIARLGDGDSQPMLRWPAARRGEVGLPAPHTLVLVLGDLGCLATRGEPLQRFWRHWGRLLHDNHNPAVALVPMPLQDIPLELARLWTVVRWDAGAAAGAAGPAASTTETVQHLLTLLAPAVRLEPGLLRAVRELLPAGSRDAGMEARVWQDAALRSQHSVAATPDPEQRKAALARFTAEPEPLRRRVLEHIRAWRAQVDEFVWFEEVLDLEPEVQRTSVEAMDLDDAQRAMQALTEILQQPGAGSTATRAWASRFLQRWPDTPGHSRGVQQAVHVLYELVRPYLDETQVPQWYDPALRATVAQTVRRVAVWQVGDQVRLQVVDPAVSPEPAVLTRGSPLGLLHSSGEVILAPGPAPESPGAFWQEGQAPAWAQAWGDDVYGAWVTFRIGAVVQRMRWIAPGRFRMGSPPEEAGRFDDEGPRHTVQLTQGFWLFDTPCTQALWQAVLGGNPSRFQGAQRPVERVSWDDCQRFLQRLHAVLPGLELSLPTEAQWEYACRAGTETPRYAEDLVPQLGSVENHPLGAPCSSPAPAATLEHGAPRRTTQLSSVEALDAIAWYDGNSHGETHDVGTKRPNAWGLYDMLGNVYEWCHDGRRTYEAGTVRDPLGPTTAGAHRALRGGSWVGAALLVRAADRGGPPPRRPRCLLGLPCREFKGEPARHSKGDVERVAALGGARADRDTASRRAEVRPATAAHRDDDPPRECGLYPPHRPGALAFWARDAPGVGDGDWTRRLWPVGHVCGQEHPATPALDPPGLFSHGLSTE